MDTSTKRCSVCSNEFPATTEYFYKKGGRTSLFAWCKRCHLNRIAPTTKAWNVAHPEQCKMHQERYQHGHTRAKHTYRPTSECPIEEQERRRAAGRTRDRRRRERNREKAKERSRTSFALWVKRHPDQSRARRHKREAQKRNLPATFTALDWKHAKRFFAINGVECCAYCGRPIGLWHTLAQDHFIPLSKGGAYTADNIIPACHGFDGCNNSKSNRDPVDWLTERFGARKAKAILNRVQDYFAFVTNRDSHDDLS